MSDIIVFTGNYSTMNLTLLLLVVFQPFGMITPVSIGFCFLFVLPVLCCWFCCSSIGELREVMISGSLRCRGVILDSFDYGSAPSPPIPGKRHHPLNRCISPHVTFMNGPYVTVLEPYLTGRTFYPFVKLIISSEYLHPLIP